MAIILEPIAVSNGWWYYANFPNERIKIFGIPICVYVAYFCAFSSLAFFRYHFSPILSIPISLLLGYATFYFAMSVHQEEIFIILYVVLIFNLYFQKNAPYKTYSTKSKLLLFLVLAIHTYCLLMCSVTWMGHFYCAYNIMSSLVFFIFFVHWNRWMKNFPKLHSGRFIEKCLQEILHELELPEERPAQSFENTSSFVM